MFTRMEPSREHPTPYPGKIRPRKAVTSSLKEQEDKTLTDTNDLSISSPQRQKRILGVSKSVNNLDLSAKDKLFTSGRRLSISSKHAIPVSKTESKETTSAVSENKYYSSKPSPLPRASTLKVEKSLGNEVNVKCSKNSLSVSFQVSSAKSEARANASSKDILFTTHGSSRSTLPTSEFLDHGQKRKPNILMSSSYWLDQIKLSDSAGKHTISLGFFRLALESAAEPFQKLRDELKAYALKNNLLEFGEVAKDVLQSYGVMEEIMPIGINGQPGEIKADVEVSLTESGRFMTSIHEMSSVIDEEGEENSNGETANKMAFECQSEADIVDFSTESGFKSALKPLSEESEVSDLRTDKGVTQKYGNIQESAHNESCGVLSVVIEPKPEALCKKTYLTEGKDISNDHVPQSISIQKSCVENGNLEVADEMGSAALSTIGGTIKRTNANKKDSRSITMPGIMSQPYTRKSTINTADKAATVKALRSTPRRSCTIITNKKKESSSRKSTSNSDNKGIALNVSSHSDLPSSLDNGQQEVKGNQPSQDVDSLSQGKISKGSRLEYNEELESRPNNPTSADSGFDILNMSVDKLMGEVVSCIMSGIDDCMDSPSLAQGYSQSLEKQTRDMTETVPTEKIISTSTLSMSDINNPCRVVLDAHDDSIGSGHFLKTSKEEMHKELDDIPFSSNGEEKDAETSIIDEEEHENCDENDANETVQLDMAENDGVEGNRNRVGQGKSKHNITKSKFQGSKAANWKGGFKKDLQNEHIANSNKENIINRSCGVSSSQLGSVAILGKEVKGLNKSNETHLRTPAGSTPGSIRRSTRLRERTAS